MATKTTFNLEASIKNWKESMLKNSSFTSDNIYELESHLLEEIDELQHLGLTEEEAFLIAKKRIGCYQELKTEFYKVNKKTSFLNNIFPYLKGVLLYLAFVSLVKTSHLFSLFAAHNLGFIDLNTISILVLVILTISVGSLIYIKYINVKFNIKNFTNTPLLVGLIIVSNFLERYAIINLSPSNFVTSNGMVLYGNVGTFKFFFILSILILSCLLYYSRKKSKNNLKLAE